MHRRLTVGALAILFFAGVFASSPRPVEAQDEEQRRAEVERQIREFQDAIDGAETERNEYAEQLAETQDRMNALLAVLAEAESALAEVGIRDWCQGSGHLGAATQSQDSRSTDCRDAARSAFDTKPHTRSCRAAVHERHAGPGRCHFRC